MQNIAVILLGSAGINIGEYYREKYDRQVHFLIFESHKTLFQAERGAIIIGQLPAETTSGDSLQKAHAVEKATDISMDYYQHVPDYIKGPLGKVLFFTTAEEQFGNNSPEKILARAEFYEREIIEAMCEYKQILLVANMGGSVSSGIAPYIAHLAKQQRIPLTAIATMPATFEGKKRRQQAEKGLAALQKKTKVVLISAVEPEESMIDYFKHKDAVVTDAIERVLNTFDVQQ